MTDYGDWFDAGPFEQAWAYTSAEGAIAASRGYQNNTRVTSGGRARNIHYELYRGSEAGTPWEDSAARVCALAHASDEHNPVSVIFYHPGTCDPVTPVSTAGVATNVVGGFIAGTRGSYVDSGLLFADRYTARVLTGTVQVGLYNNSGIDYVGDPFFRYYRSVPADVLMQVPGWYDYVSTRPGTADQPQVEPTLISVDQVRLEITASDGAYGSVNAHRISPDETLVPPASAATGAVDMTVSGGAGATSGALAWPDLARGEAHQWHVVTSRIEAQADPGQGSPGQVPDSFVAEGVLRYRARWSVRARIPRIVRTPRVAPPLRQVQRDDGLGRSPARARAVASRQGSQRQRAYL